MPESLYSALVSGALRLDRGGEILGCAINARCIAVQTTAGVGLAFVPAAAWARAQRSGLHSSDAALRGRRLADVIPRYLREDPLEVVIALGAMNSLFIAGGETDPGDWFAGMRVRRLGMIGDLRPFADHNGLADCERTIFELLPLPDTHGPEEAPLLLPACDLVLVTSAVFSNKTLHYYLPYLAGAARAFIFGHGTPLADVLLDRFTLAGSRVLDAAGVFRSLREGKGIRELKPFLRKVIRNRWSDAPSRADRRINGDSRALADPVRLTSPETSE